MKFLRQITQLVVRQQKFLNAQTLCCAESHFVRYKYSQNSGVKGQKGRKFNNVENEKEDDENDEITADSDLFEHSDYDFIANSTMNVTKNILNIQRILVIQPYIKWGPRKSLTKPELALQEAEALVRSIPTWAVEHSLKVPLESLDKQSLFGSGKMEEIRHLIQDIRRNGKQVKYRLYYFDSFHAIIGNI